MSLSSIFIKNNMYFDLLLSTHKQITLGDLQKDTHFETHKKGPQIIKSLSGFCVLMIFHGHRGPQNFGVYCLKYQG